MSTSQAEAKSRLNPAHGCSRYFAWPRSNLRLGPCASPKKSVTLDCDSCRFWGPHLTPRTAEARRPGDPF